MIYTIGYAIIVDGAMRAAQAVYVRASKGLEEAVHYVHTETV